MVARLLYRKCGEFVDEKTGELIKYDKIGVSGTTVEYKSNRGCQKQGFFVQEYKVSCPEFTTEELVPMFGKIVSINFDFIVGERDPVVASIELLDE